VSSVRPPVQRVEPSAGTPAFAEAPAWSAVGAGWRPLFGSFRKLGFSFEWHDFTSAKELDWARSFHPGSIELCLNLDGSATIKDGQQSVELSARAFAFYYQGDPPLVATRRAGERHRFITVEFSPTFLQQHFRKQADNLHPLVRSVVKGETRTSLVTSPERLGISLQQLVESLRHCPVFSPAQEMWFRCKALELAAHLFYRPAGGELFCTRAQRAARERVERARVILKERLQSPPSLDELGKLVGCSPFYLSRLFSQEAGMTIQQYIRQTRMERAAELLRTGKCNVTEAALEVGYNSLSHFSSAFHATFGCCPGLFPLRTPTQKGIHEDNLPPKAADA
jgi:AraC-like DNA-binding protein